jgi:hypothetical protein
MFSNINNYSTLNSDHNWKDLCIHLRDQQTCTSSLHNQIRGGLIFNLVLVDVPS